MSGEPFSRVLSVREGVIELVGYDDPDVTLSGSASELLLAVWNRVPLSRLMVTGDEGRVQQLLDLIRI